MILFYYDTNINFINISSLFWGTVGILCNNYSECTSKFLNSTFDRLRILLKIWKQKSHSFTYYYVAYFLKTDYVLKTRSGREKWSMTRFARKIRPPTQGND